MSCCTWPGNCSTRLRVASTNARATPTWRSRPSGRARCTNRKKEPVMTSSTPPTANRVMELPVRGMDCAECTQHVQHALAAVPGVESVEVFLTSEKAVLRLAPVGVPMDTLRRAVESAGYSVEDATIEAQMQRPS